MKQDQPIETNTRRTQPESHKEINPSKHTIIDDVQGILIGSLFASFGISIFSHMHFLIGGTVGISFLTQYSTSLSFSSVFFVINIPFYALSIFKLGWEFTIKTFLAVFTVSFLTEVIPMVFEFGDIEPWFASTFGGFLIGSGLLMLFRHKASLGGLNIVSIFLQENYNISAGKFQMSVDTLIVLAAFFIVDWQALVFSVLAAISLNIILAINHKPGRYRAMS